MLNNLLYSDGSSRVIMEPSDYKKIYNDWVEECKFTSSISIMMEHKNFFILTQYAYDNLDYLINYLYHDSWIGLFPLLHIVFGVNPIQDQNRGKISEMAKDWRHWYDCIGKYRIKTMRYSRIYYQDDLPDLELPYTKEEIKDNDIFYSFNYKKLGDTYYDGSAKVFKVRKGHISRHGVLIYSEHGTGITKINFYGNTNHVIDRKVAGLITMFKYYGQFYREIVVEIDHGVVKNIRRVE